MTDPTPVPRNLVEAAEREGRTAWLGTVAGHRRPAGPRVVADRGGAVPARRTDGLGRAGTRPAAGAERVLKVGWRTPRPRTRPTGCGRGPGGAPCGCTPPSVRRHERAAAGALPAGHAAGRPTGTGAGRGDRRAAAAGCGSTRRPGTGSGRCRPCATSGPRSSKHRLAAAPGLLDPGLAREGMRAVPALPATADRRCCWPPTLTPATCSTRRGWLLIDPKPHDGTPRTTRCSTCSTARNGCRPTPAASPSGWPTCSDWTPSGCGGGCSPAASRSTRTATAGRRRPPDPDRLTPGSLAPVRPCRRSENRSRRAIARPDTDGGGSMTADAVHEDQDDSGDGSRAGAAGSTSVPRTSSIWATTPRSACAWAAPTSCTSAHVPARTSCGPRRPPAPGTGCARFAAWSLRDAGTRNH